MSPGWHSSVSKHDNAIWLVVHVSLDLPQLLDLIEQSFSIPAAEVLSRARFSQRNGTGVLVLSPTRELALQTYNVTAELMRCVASNGRTRAFAARRLCTHPALTPPACAQLPRQYARCGVWRQ